MILFMSVPTMAGSSDQIFDITKKQAFAIYLQMPVFFYPILP